MSLTVSNICKSYDGKRVLNDISFAIDSGEIVGFLGPNGTGKSTLMKIITGYVRPDSGSVYVCGRHVQNEALDTKRLIGYLPEHNPLYTDMYIREYLSFVADFYQIDHKRNRIETMIERTGLGPESHKRIGQLSKGYRQRVGLAQALLHEPQVLILDEPTTGLDPNQIVGIRQLIAEAGHDKTVLFSTHIMQEVEALCQRVIVINHGNIAADADTQNILADFGTTLLFEVEFDTQPNAAWRTLPHITAVTELQPLHFRITADADVRSELFRFATEHHIGILTLRQVEHHMEDIFRKLTQ